MTPRHRLLVMSAGHLLNDGAANYLPGVLPMVLVSLGAPKSQAGVLMGALLIGQALQPAIGYVSDEVGGKSITLGGMCIATFAGALIGLAPSYWALIGLLAIIGVANSCFHPQALAGVRSLAQGRRGLSTSTFLIGGELGRGVWPLAGGLVVQWLGLNWIWLLAVPLVLALPLLIVSFPSLPVRHPDRPPIRWREHLGPLSRVVTFTALRIMLVFLMVTFLPFWWVEQGGSLVGGSALVMVLYVAGILGNAAGGHFADQWGHRRVAALASVASVGLLAALPLCRGPLLWGVLSLLGMSLFATLPISVTLAQDALPENPSLGSGVGLGLCNAIGAAAVMVLGLWADRLGVTAMLWAAAIISVPAAASALALPRHQAPPSTTNPT